MKTIEVWKDTRKRGTCRGCGRPVEWAVVAASGAWMIFDAVVVVGQRIVVHQPDLFSPLVHRTALTVDLERNHWASCPQAPAFKS